MNTTDSFKLEKLKITDLTEGSGQQSPFEVMFNPESFKRQYGNRVQKSRGINNNGQQEAVPAGSLPENLELHLVIDGTGAADFGLPTGLGGKSKPVQEQIKAFLDLCQQHHGDQYGPNRVNIKWGIIDFNARLESLDITYNAFDRNGQPLRAELDVVFTEDNPSEENGATTTPGSAENSSPDLTHVRTVKAGDTLPLLTREIYGSSEHYLFVASANRLDNFRKLEPGQELGFPPLEQ